MQSIRKRGGRRGVEKRTKKQKGRAKASSGRLGKAGAWQEERGEEEAEQLVGGEGLLAWRRVAEVHAAAAGGGAVEGVAGGDGRANGAAALRRDDRHARHCHRGLLGEGARGRELESATEWESLVFRHELFPLFGGYFMK